MNYSAFLNKLYILFYILFYSESLNILKILNYIKYCFIYSEYLNSLIISYY